MNFPPPSVRRHPRVSPLASLAHGSQSLKELKDLSLLQNRRTHDFLVNSLSSRPTYVFPDSESEL